MKQIPSWLTDLHSLFKKVESNLKKEKWFKEGGWRTHVYYFPSEEAPEWAAMHLSKKNWFNDERQGIHFEVGFGPGDKNAKDLKIVLHMHPKVVPGSTVKRETVIGQFLDEASTVLKKLPGCKLKTGWKGVESLSFRKDTLKDELVDDLAAEFSRIQVLGEYMDRALTSAREN
jgi:hypothetical protein